MVSPCIIGLAGLAGSGKSVVSQLATSEFSFALIRPGVAITKWLEARGLDGTAENERLAQVELRNEKKSMSALVEIAQPEIVAQASQGCRIILDSLCSFDEISYLVNSGVGNLTTLAIHAPSSSRKEWVSARSQRPYNPYELNLRDSLEIEVLQKGKLLALADIHIANNSGVDELKGQARDLITRLLATK